MRSTLSFALLLLAAHITPALAEFDFYTEKCKTTKSTGKCNGKLVDGPRCLKKGSDVCKEYKTERDCGWKSQGLGGATKMVCETTEGECLAYEKSCLVYQKVCSGGTAIKVKSCKKSLKPLTEIQSHLALAVYKRYLKSLNAGNIKPLHSRLVKEFQPHFTVKLNTLSVALAADSAIGPGITDCSVMYFSDAKFVNKLVTGQQLGDEDNVMYLLHALRHAQHCQGMGGRDIFAREWFKAVPIKVSKKQRKIEPVLIKTVKDIRAKDMEYLHELMPIEEDAVSYSISMLPVIQSSTRHGKGAGETRIPKSKKDKFAIGVGVGSPPRRGLYGK